MKYGNKVNEIKRVGEDEMWKFTEISRIEERIFNPLLETFLGYGLNALVRENIQNALDAKLKELSEPVIVKINTGVMNVSDIPGIESIKERIGCLQGGNDYATKSVADMVLKKDEQEINYITFEDINTKGLTKDTWEYYAYKKGAHYTEADESIENVRGGSHGVGKIASNAASDLHMMFFANCDDKGEKKLGGTIQLIEHEYRGKIYRSTGYFTNWNEQQEFFPYENIEAPLFQKNTRGLKIIIPFLREQYNDANGIIRAVCDNFFVAILQGRLIIHVGDKIIDKQSIADIMVDQEIYNEEDINNFTRLYVETYLQSCSELKIKDKHKAYDFYLYFRYNENIHRGRVGIIRSIGMKIEDFKVKSHSKTPFNAVLIPKTEEGDKFLKSLENESHTKLSAKNIRSAEAQMNATRFINNLHKAISEHIARIMREINPADDIIDTSDLLFSVENKFKQQLTAKATTIVITGKKKGSKRTIIKKDVNKTAPKSNRNPQPDKKPTSGTSSKPRKRKGNNPGEEVYVLPIKQNQVKRVIIQDKERCRLEVADIKYYKKEERCNIHIDVVDGQGKISEDILDLTKYYSEVRDIQSNKHCKIKNNCILDVMLRNGGVALEMQTIKGVNQALKFTYLVEVQG